MYWGHHYWGMHGVWWIFWAILIAVLVIRAWSNQRASFDDALGELRRRYAAGEIDDEEYQHRLEVLRSGNKSDLPGRPQAPHEEDPELHAS